MMEIRHGNCLDVLAVAARAGERFHSVVTDPPYHLTSIQKRFGKEGSAPAQHGRDGSFARLSKGFMGKSWDGGDVAFQPETWRRVWDVLHPGAHMAVFGGTRTFFRMAVAIEDAGFEVRDELLWLYGTGFPKSHDVSKGIDKVFGAEREVVGTKLGLPGYHLHGHDGGEAFGHGLSSSTYETRLASSQITAPATEEAAIWTGWGTALKPAHEPILLVRKPLEGTVAGNVLAYGCGGLNIDACRVETDENLNGGAYSKAERNPESGEFFSAISGGRTGLDYQQPAGRWPPNILHDGSPEVLEAFGRFGDRPGQLARARTDGAPQESVALGRKGAKTNNPDPRGDEGSAARFFPALGYTDEDLRFWYSGKANKAERMGSKHPTVKPIALLRWLARLITPPGGRILDPFAGTGTTGAAARAEGFGFTGIEMTDEYVEDCLRRLPEATLDQGPWGLGLKDALARNRAAREALLARTA